MHQVAFLCRYGNQDFYRVLGRNPRRKPMTAVERAVFAHCLEKLWEAEMAPRKEGSGE